MNTPETPSNLYRPPQSFGDCSSPSVRRPGGLNAICVIVIILGGLGLASSMMGLCAMATKPWINKAFIAPPQPGKVDKMREAQLEMQQKTEEVTGRYAGFNLGFSLLNVLISGSLVTGGILALRLNPKGRRLLLVAFSAAIVFEILRAVVQSCMQIEMAEVVQDSMSRMMNGGAGTPESAAVTAVAMKVGMYLGLAVWLVFALAKVIFYAIGTSYLRRPDIHQLFGNIES